MEAAKFDNGILGYGTIQGMLQPPSRNDRKVYNLLVTKVNYLVKCISNRFSTRVWFDKNMGKVVKIRGLIKYDYNRNPIEIHADSFELVDVDYDKLTLVK